MKSVKGIFLLGLLLAIGLAYSLASNVPTAAAATVVGCGTSSSADGEQMILNGNIVNCAGPAVTITHDKVHLNMNGFTIDGNLTGIGIHIINAINPTNAICVPRPGPSGVHINGGTVKQFDYGIFLCRSSKAHINGMTAKYNDLAGILIDRGHNDEGGAGNAGNHQINGSTLKFNGCRTLVEVEDEAGYFVEEPTCLDPFSEGGLVMDTSTGNTIHTMNIHDNNRTGVLFKFSSGKITSSEIHDNVGGAVGVDRGGATTIQSNNMTGNGAGIGVSAGGGGNIIRGNTIDGNNFGITINGTPNNLVRSNTVINGCHGLSLITTTGNLVQSNTVLNNCFRDVFENNGVNNIPPCVNTWKNNTLGTFNNVDPAGCIQ